MTEPATVFKNREEIKLPGSIQNNVLTWCPVMQVIAVSPIETGAVWVYRLSGERVWTANTKKKCKVVQMTWRYDGKLLGIIYEDGSSQILNGSNGKLVSSTAEQDEQKKLTAIKWAQDKSSNTHQLDELLPNNLFGLDIMKNLPKLPSLPSTTFQAFSKVTLDETAETTDMLITGTKSGQIELTLYGVFSIGSVQISNNNNDKVMDIVSTGDLSHLLAIVCDDKTQHLIKVNVGFIKKFGLTYLPEVSLTPAKVYALVDYIQEAVNVIHKEGETLRNQAKKSLGLLNENAELVKSALYDTLLTGNPPKAIEKWLAHELGDRGLKRWSKTAIGCYDIIKKVVFENLIPGCERLVILLTRLRGLSKWQERGEPLGLIPERFDKAVNQASAIITQAHLLLKRSGKEHFYFKAFAAWLEVLYENIPDAPPPASGKSLFDDPSHVKTLDVASFITTYLDDEGNNTLIGEDNDLSRKGTQNLRELCDHAFDESKKAMHSHITIESILPLAPADETYKVQQYYDPSTDYWYVLIYQSGEHEFQLIRFKVNSQSGETNIAEAVIVEGQDQIVQVQFINHDTIMLIVKNQTISEQRALLTMAFNNLPYNLLSFEELQLGPSIHAVVQRKATKRTLFSELKWEFNDGDFIPEAFAMDDQADGFILSSDDKKSIFFDISTESAYPPPAVEEGYSGDFADEEDEDL